MNGSISKWRRRLVGMVAVPLALVVAGCGRGTVGAGGGEVEKGAVATPAAVGTSVSIDNFNFTPATITVAVGETVTWVNHDDVPHTVTANDKGFGSKAMDSDEQYSHAFTAAGTYAYYCAVHPHMTGTVVVK